jgi:hypothetical protein
MYEDLEGTEPLFLGKRQRLDDFVQNALLYFRHSLLIFIDDSVDSAARVLIILRKILHHSLSVRLGSRIKERDNCLSRACGKSFALLCHGVQGVRRVLSVLS